MVRVNAKDVERALADLDFPADKSRLVAHVDGKAAEEVDVDVKRQIHGIPPAEYRNVGDVVAAVDLE